MGWEGVDYMHLSQDKDQVGGALNSMEMNLFIL
jgi:hypothetical protein